MGLPRVSSLIRCLTHLTQASCHMLNHLSWGGGGSGSAGDLGQVKRHCGLNAVIFSVYLGSV